MRKLSIGKLLVPETKTTMFTVPTKYTASWTLLFASNGTSSAKAFNAWWYDVSEDVEVPIVFNFPLNRSTPLQFGGAGQYVQLEEGDQVRVEIAEGATDSSCLVSFEIEPRLATQFNVTNGV
jgi:hypothetical protein